MHDPILQKAQQTLNTAIFWFLGCGAIAVYAGVTVQPSASYTAGAAIMGLAWAVLLVVFWHTRPSWSFVATVILVLGLSIFRDFTFPGTGFLRGIYGGAVAIAVGTLLLRVFRRLVSHFCRLDRNEPIA